MSKLTFVESASAGTILVILFIFIGGIFGWGRNIYKLAKCDFEAPYKAEIIRGIGIIPPVGAILGYCNISDGKK